MTEQKQEQKPDPHPIISSFELKDKLLAEGEIRPLVNIMSKFPSLDYAIENFHDGELIAVSGYTKHGKCMARGTRVLMFDGSIKEIQDIVVGDKLMGDDSTPRVVLSTCNGYDKLYKIKPWQGTPYTVNGDHILCLQRTNITNKKTDNLRGSVKEISVLDYEQLSLSQKHRYKTYRVPVEFPDIEVPIDPYFLGLWLGDGTSVYPSITTEDKEIVEYLYAFAEQHGYRINVVDQGHNKSKVYRVCDNQEGTGRIRKNRLLDELRALYLVANKHIPHVYKANSREIRLKLLAGLIDTDGNYVKSTRGGALEFVNKSQTLIEDVAYLCRSLGFACTPHKTTKKIKSTGFSGEYWTMRISGDISKIPCLLERKTRNGMKPFKDILRSSFKVEEVGGGEYFGFELDGNGRYLLSDFQVTHNTTLCQTLTKNFAEQQYFSLWFSYEVTPRQFLNSFDDADLPLFFVPDGLVARSMEWVEKKILESLKKYNTRIVFVDHLHYLFDMVARQNISLTIGTVVRALKRIAVNNKIVIFLLCHTGKPITDGGELNHGAIRDSSFVAQESDCVILVSRTGNNEGQIKVEFHRRTGCFQRVVPIMKVGKYFHEMAREEEGEYSDGYKKGGR